MVLAPRFLLTTLVCLSVLVAALAATLPAPVQAATKQRADASAPRIAVTAPRKRTVVSGVVRARTRVRDNRRVRRVVFRVNGRRLAVRRRAPYVARLDTRRLRNGRHLLRATAYDGAGNHRSRVVSFVVRNAKPAAQPPQPAQNASALAVGSSGGVGTFTPVPITGTAYYVSSTGSDSDDGRSPQTAWRTVRQANRAVLAPGDGVLFEAGATFADDALIPARGGAQGRPVVYGSFGAGRARLPKGVWFRGLDDLAFQNLALPGATQGLQGHGHRVTAQGLEVAGNSIGIHAEGDDWTVEANTVDGAGDSGMILVGARHTVRGNLITNSGHDASIPYGKHGIYLKVVDAVVVENTIRGFSDNGVSVRYRNSRIERNTISGGPIGIAWFQYDAVAGTSTWRGNDISGTTAAGIYVSREDRAGPTRESFVIAGNRIAPAGGRHLDLPAIQGTYDVSGNLEA